MARDPYVVAWTDQFGALLRDKCVQMLQVIELTDWNSIAHIFNDPFDDDRWRLVYEDGQFLLLNLSQEGAAVIVLDLGTLGVEP